MLLHHLPDSYDEAGTYGPESGQQVINEDVTISADGVILQNTIIKGDLTLTDKIGDGDVTLINVTVEGKTCINGGGQNSIILENCKLAKTIVNKKDGKIRIILKDTTIAKLVADSGMKLEGDGKITYLAINSNGVEVGIKPVNEPKLKSGVTAKVAGETKRGTTSGGGGSGGSSKVNVSAITNNQI